MNERTLLQTVVNLTDLFTQHPGDFFYHLVLVLTLAAGFFIALGQRRRHPESLSSSRYMLASGGALLGWAVLIIGAVFALLTRQEANTILPPLERAVNVTAMLLIGWAFLTADSEQWGNGPNLALLVLLVTVILGYIVTGIQWPLIAPGTDFNLSRLGVAWTFIQAITALVGFVTMLAYLLGAFNRTVVDSPLKLVYFVVLLLGHGGSLAQMSSGLMVGDYSGLSRLALLAVAPILPIIVYRNTIGQLETTILKARRAAERMNDAKATTVAPAPVQAAPPKQTASPVERESVQLLRVLGIILEETKPSEIPLKIIRSTVDVLKADVGVLLTIKDANYADISLAYDRAMQRAIPAMLSLNLEAQPTLVNCIERRQQRPLFADRNTDELRDLYDRLDIGQIGPAYFQPLMRGDEIIGLMVIGLPYAKRELRDSEREQLKGIGIIAGSLLALSYEADHARQRAEERAIQAMISGIPIDEIDDADVVAARKEMEAALDEARIHNNELQRHIALLKIELDDERSRLMRLLGDTEADMSISQRIIAINDDQERLRAERDELAQQLEEAETALASATGTDTEAMVQTLTETLRREKDSLEAERDALVAQLAEIRGEGVPSEEVNLNEVMAQMTAEKMRLEADTEVMQGRLQDIEGQLEALGIEGGAAGLAQLVRQLYDQRAALQARSDGLQIERDALWNERKRFEARIKREAEREANIEEMQTEIQHLASDREAITRQRDQYRAERDELAVKNDAVRRHRARLLAEASAFEQELEEVREETQYLRVEMQRLLDERSQWIQERDRLIANNSRLMAEIGQDSVSPEDLMSALDSTGSMQRSITELAGERSRLEAELNRTRMLLNTTEQELFELRNNARETGRSSAEADAEAILGLVQELRSPLTSVMGYVDLLETESISGFLGEQQRRYLARVGANVVRLQSMVEELVHLTALETGRFALDTKPVDLVEVVEEVIDATSPQFREKGLTLHLNLDDDVPPVNADPEAMSQVINALLMNAYLVTPADSDVFVQAGKRAVTLNGSGPVDCLLVSVEDRGGGIADVDKALVFARRYKVEHSLIAGLGDTGVGLSIAKAIVEAHGGAIWVDSVEGVGTMMRFALPYASEETPA